MYNTKPNQEVNKQELMEKFNIAPLENMLRANRLSWYGHVERSSGWINRCRSIKSPAPKGLADPRRHGMKLYGAIEKPGNWWMQTHKTAPLGDIGGVKPRTVRLHVWKMRRKPGPWFNIKMSSYQYRKSYCGDKTILRPSHLHNGISYTGKTTSLYWIRALDMSVCL